MIFHFENYIFVLGLNALDLKKAYFTADGGKNLQVSFITPKMREFKKYNLFLSPLIYFPNLKLSTKKIKFENFKWIWMCRGPF